TVRATRPVLSHECEPFTSGGFGADPCEGREMRRHSLLVSLLVVLTLGNWCAAGAQTVVITAIAPGGFAAAMNALIVGFEQKTGYTVRPTYGSGNGTRQQV